MGWSIDESEDDTLHIMRPALENIESVGSTLGNGTGISCTSVHTAPVKKNSNNSN